MKKITKFLPLALIILSFLALYFLLRLPNLTLQPIFADEAIYIRWAQVMRAEPTLRFLPVSDGKTPLFMWLTIPFFKLFEDPLLAGRVLSVFSGLVTILGMFFLGTRFFSLRVGLWGAFLGIISPYLVFFDRLALVDSMLAAFSIWALNLALMLAKFPRLDLAMILGFVIGGSMLTKPPGFFNILVLPITALMINWKDPLRQWKVLKLFGLWLVTLGITLVVYNILRLGPGFDNLNSRNQDYVFSPSELQGRWLDPFIPHFNDLVDWFPKLLTIPTLVLILLGVGLVFLKRNKIGVIILIWALVPLMIQMAFLRTFTARYLLFSIPPLILIGGLGVDFLISKFKFNPLFKNLILGLIFLIPTLYFNQLILTNPALAPLPKTERRGYLEDWTAGYGLKEIAEYLMVKAREGVIVVGTEGSFGTLPDGLQIYLDKYHHSASEKNRILIVGGKATISAQIKQAALDHPTYFVANESRFLGDQKTELILRFPKAKSPDGSEDAILLFKISP